MIGGAFMLPAVITRVLPAMLAAAHKAPFATDHDGYDFQPSDEFDSLEETEQWWTAWTDNEDAGLPPFRFFGGDGSGGRAAIWLRDPNAAIETQPVVFLGSEGELAVIAKDLGDYVWLLANGFGPLETVDELDRVPQPVPELIALAPGEPRSITAVIVDAEMLLPALQEFVDETCHGPFDDGGEPLIQRLDGVGDGQDPGRLT